jgi:PAS domain S-box-containing protein
MLIICDSTGKNVYASANCVNITGYSREELIGKYSCWVHLDDLPRMKVILEAALKTKSGGHNVEFKGIKKDGEIWYGSQSWEPVKDHQGNLTQFVIQVIDITDRIPVEESSKQPEKPFSGIANKLSDPAG